MDDEPAGLVHLEHLPARRGRTVDWPADLPSAVVDRVEASGVERPWPHQVEVYERARAGEDVVVATGTASGKTLAYELPAFHELHDDPRSVVLYLAPTKALAHDQLRALRQRRLPWVRAAALDGDTPTEERAAIRRGANWILTNPDLLHASLLGDHARWADVLHRCRLVIIDECHTARGVFGSQVALVLRRLRRLLERYDADPRFLLASATIGNPAEHASALIGSPVVAVEQDASPHGPVDLGFWLPPRDEDGSRRSTLQDSGQLLAAFVGAGVRTLAFTRSRRGAEVVALRARELLAERDPDLADRVAAYRAGYLAEDRRALEDNLRSGALLGVAATQALELGIDISALDAVVLAGWPGTTAAFWQQVGRAGRSDDPSVGVFVAQEDPLDHYLVAHPRQLLTRPPEAATIDPANPYLLGPQLACACEDAPLDDDEVAVRFGASAPRLLEDLIASGSVRRRGGRTYWVGRHRASSLVSLRGVGGAPVRIVDSATGQVIGDVDEARAHRQLHRGAIHLHQGRALRVQELDLDSGVALVADEPASDRTTRARVATDVKVVERTTLRVLGDVQIAAGRVEVSTQVTGFDELRIGDREVLGRFPLDLPPLELATRAVWWTLPERALDAEGIEAARVPGALHAAEHAAIGMLPLIALCDRWDLGGLSTADHPDTAQPTVFIYDAVAGGAGLTERSFDRIGEHLQLTRDTIVRCRCRSGCPSCVQSPKCGNGNEPLDKRGAVQVLELLLAALETDA